MASVDHLHLLVSVWQSYYPLFFLLISYTLFHLFVISSHRQLSHPNLTFIAPSKMTITDSAHQSRPEDFPGKLKVSERLPTKSELSKVENLPIFNSKGESIPFSSLWTRQRTMIVFIRHFLCGVCSNSVGTYARK